MPDRRPDAFEALRQPVAPLAPSDDFAAALRRRIEEELHMTDVDARARTGRLAMVHLRVPDADRAMRFFGDLFGWEGERWAPGDHVSWYTLNAGDVTVRLLDDAGYPPLVPNFGVEDVGTAVAAIERAGGRIDESEIADDGGGWARGADDDGLPLLVYRPRGRDHAPATSTAIGRVGFVFVRKDADRAQRFYGAVFGWTLDRAHPDSSYFDAVEGVGVFDEAAAFGRPVEPSVTVYFEVPSMADALDRVRALGGVAGPAEQDMGHLWSAMCADDQGTTFGLASSNA